MITTLLTCHKKVYYLSCISVDVSCLYWSRWLRYIYNDDDILVYWLFISLVKTISYICSSVWVLQEVNDMNIKISAKNVLLVYERSIINPSGYCSTWTSSSSFIENVVLCWKASFDS